MWLPQRGFRYHIISLYYWNNNQPPHGPCFHSCFNIRWSGVFYYSCFSLFYSHFPINLTLCDHIFHTCFTCPWNVFSCVVSFLHSLVLKRSLLALFSLVSCFCPILSSITNEFISWDPCMPSSRCWHYKRLSKVYIIQIGHKNMCLNLIFIFIIFWLNLIELQILIK